MDNYKRNEKIVILKKKRNKKRWKKITWEDDITIFDIDENPC
jgi:hypothetical protein